MPGEGREWHDDILGGVRWRRRSVLGLLAGGTVGFVGGSARWPSDLSWQPAQDGEHAARLRSVATRFLRPTPEHPHHPTYPGVSVFAAVGGRAVARLAVGDAVRYGAGRTPLAEKARVPATWDTLYDLASLTKLFTTVLVMRLVERGRVELDAPVERYLPDFTGKPAVTVRMLLAHTSGLSQHVDTAPAGREQRLARVLRDPVRTAPGTEYRYVDKNFIVLGALVERLAGQRLDVLVREQITEPLRLRDTMFLPPRSRWERVAATEGTRRGTVHDPVAVALDGVAGHAGLFSTAADVGRFGHALIDGRGLGLSPATVALMRTDQNGRLGAEAAHGLGVDVNQPWYMGRLAGPQPRPATHGLARRLPGVPSTPDHGGAGTAAFGHTGFTGTSLVVEPVRRVVLVLLANRVHPTPAWGGMNPARRAAADTLAG